MTLTRVFAASVLVLGVFSCKGQKLALYNEGDLGVASTQALSGASSVAGADLGLIYTVSTVIPATQGHRLANDAELPFLGVPLTFGQFITDRQTPFYFSYAYPANNYKLQEARIVMDTARDSSNTEGIWVDGVMTGIPPSARVNSASPLFASWQKHYRGNPGALPENIFYIQWSLEHYKASAVPPAAVTKNTFDLSVGSLLSGSTLSLVDAVKDGDLQVVTGDDSPVYAANLILTGYTISKTPLSCSNSPTYDFGNVYVHSDGNTIGAPAFNGTVLSPFNSWNAAAGFQSVEWNYDAKLPKVAVSNISITEAKLNLNVRRRTAVSPLAAVVVNGVGVGETGFDRTSATSAVESWENGGGAVAYLESWAAAIPSDGAPTAVSLDLVAMLGATRVRTLLAQGKLNVALAGSIGYAQGSGNTSARVLPAAPTIPTATNPPAVTGPEFVVKGTYFTQVCAIPNDPSSPLNDAGGLPAQTGDNRSPAISSLQVAQVTNNSAVLQWLTDEPATTRAKYGIGGLGSQSALDSTPSTFHSVTLTGLSPYKVYQFQVLSEDFATADDGSGAPDPNRSTSNVYTFQTLR